MKRAVDFTNRRDVAEWISAMASLADELADIATEAMRPKGERVVSKPALRRDLATAARKVQRLVKAARRGNRKRPTT